MQGLKAGVNHLHALGLAHNDINPLNVMFSDSGEPVLLDFDTCQPLGTELSKGGGVGEWEGIAVKQFKVSSIECDEAALEFVGKWLEQKFEELTSTLPEDEEEGP